MKVTTLVENTRLEGRKDLSAEHREKGLSGIEGGYERKAGLFANRQQCRDLERPLVGRSSNLTDDGCCSAKTGAGYDPARQDGIVVEADCAGARRSHCSKSY